MSTDKKNTENGAMEVEETSNDETSDTKPVVNTDASEESLKSKDKDSKKKLKGKEVKKDSKAGNAKPAKDGKVGKVKDEDSKSEDEDDEDEDDDDEDDKSGDGKVPLLDQPLELSGTRERKKVTRFSEEYKTEPKDSTPIEIPEGSGTQLGNIPRIEANIQRSKPDALKPLHRILFNRAGKASTLRKSIRKFNGFDFDKDSDQYAKKKQVISKLDTKSVKEVCSILDLKKNQKRDELNETLLNFLMKPEDSGKGSGKPRPKRAARANNKTYSESDDEEDEEEERKSSRRGKKKRANLKEMSSDEEDEIEDENDEKANKKDDNASDNDKKEKDAKENDSVDDAKENDSENEEDSKDGDKDEGSSDDSEETSSKSKKARSGKNNKKQSTKKPKAAPKKAEKKQLSKKKTKSGDESSEDEPLSKKSKAPPTDEEIKSYVKEILEGANLEETTMKIVCKQVYAHYPDFDLAHKKDFIKTTVKSLIST